MKNIALLTLLLLATFASAAPKSDEYTVIIHVYSAHWGNTQDLSVTIDGKNYELVGAPGDGLLALGDYKAKLVKDEHKNTYESFRIYELLFPDDKTRKYSVVGQSEQ